MSSPRVRAPHTPRVPGRAAAQANVSRRPSSYRPKNYRPYTRQSARAGSRDDERKSGRAHPTVLHAGSASAPPSRESRCACACA